MKRHVVWILALATLLVTESRSAMAAEVEWLGGVSNDVIDSANWVGGVAPTGGDRAVFRADGSTGTPDVGANNVTWGRIRLNNIAPTTLNGSGTVTLSGSNPVFFSEGGPVALPSIINSNLTTGEDIQVNGGHSVTFNGTVTARKVEAFGGTTSTYNGNVTVTDEFISGNAVIVFNGDYRRNANPVGLGINNSGSDITFKTLSSADPNHPNGVDILNLYSGHTIRNGQDNTFNDSKPWSRDGINTYSLNGFNDNITFLGTNGGTSLNVQFGAASGANSLVWQQPLFMDGTYAVQQFQPGLDSLLLGSAASFDGTQLSKITVNGISYAATDPMNFNGQYWNLDANNFVTIHQSVPEPSAMVFACLGLVAGLLRFPTSRKDRK
jgi:hypothetical protein